MIIRNNIEVIIGIMQIMVVSMMNKSIPCPCKSECVYRDVHCVVVNHSVIHRRHPLWYRNLAAQEFSPALRQKPAPAHTVAVVVFDVRHEPVLSQGAEIRPLRIGELDVLCNVDVILVEASYALAELYQCTDVAFADSFPVDSVRALDGNAPAPSFVNHALCPLSELLIGEVLYPCFTHLLCLSISRLVFSASVFSAHIAIAPLCVGLVVVR